MALEVRYRTLEDLIPYARNSRTHSEAQVAQIASSIREFGFTNPVLIDGSGGIIAGHGRVMAARKLKMTQVPVIELAHLTETQKQAYILADNKLALNAGWDEEILAIELEGLKLDGFDLEMTGFTLDEIDELVVEEIPPGLTDEDSCPEVQPDPISKPGDVWILGKHRVMCGDSTSIDAVEALMNGRKADMVFTDPPYGISIVSSNGKVGGGKLAKNGLYAPVAGDDSVETAIEAIHIISALGAKVEIIWGGNYYAGHLPNSPCWIVWDKQINGNFADCELAWTNQKTAVRKFDHMWNGMIKASERGLKRLHPTQKPVALAEWCIETYGQECDTVLDLFGGSGFTLIACEQKNKTAFIMELSPNYIDVIVKRWQEFTGNQATLERDGRTFAEVNNGG